MAEFSVHHRSPVTSPPGFVPRGGDLVSAKFSDGAWYRAKIRRASPIKKEAEVTFIDYGNQDTIAFSNIRPLDPKFRSLPGQAHDARLRSVDSFVYRVYAGYQRVIFGIALSNLPPRKVITMKRPSTVSAQFVKAANWSLTLITGKARSFICASLIAPILPQHRIPLPASTRILLAKVWLRLTARVASIFPRIHKSSRNCKLRLSKPNVIVQECLSLEMSKKTTKQLYYLPTSRACARNKFLHLHVTNSTSCSNCLAHGKVPAS